MSSVREAIESFESRLQRLDNVLGDVGDADLYELISLMYVEVRKMFYQGQVYSEQLMGLLDGFSTNETVDESEKKLRVLMSCYNELNRSLRWLDQLESFMSKLETGIKTGPEAPVELGALVELPALMNRCHSLLVRSILVAKRFMEMNLRFNEFWIKVDGKLSESF